MANNKEDKKPIYKQPWVWSVAAVIGFLIIAIIVYVVFFGSGVSEEQFFKNIAKAEGISLTKAKDLYDIKPMPPADPFA